MNIDWQEFQIRMKRRKKKSDPLIEAISEVFPGATITEGYEATKKQLGKIKPRKR